MPFHPERYPANWKAISLAVRERAGQRCEECGVPNGELGKRDKTGIWWQEDSIHNLNSDEGWELFGEFPDMIRIVLTVHHVCQDPSCADEAHMKALCQRCHLAADTGMRVRHAAETRRKRVMDLGQLALGAME